MNAPRPPSVLRFCAHTVLPVLVGGLLYVGFRDDDLLFWRWAHALGVDPLLTLTRQGLLGVPFAVPDWVRFSLPDALWTYGLAYGVARLADHRVYWLTPLVLGPGAEVAQALGLLPGVFDPIDLALCSAAVGLGIWAAVHKRRQDDEECMDAPAGAVELGGHLRAARSGHVRARRG